LANVQRSFRKGLRSSRWTVWPGLGRKGPIFDIREIREDSFDSHLLEEFEDPVEPDPERIFAIRDGLHDGDDRRGDPRSHQRSIPGSSSTSGRSRTSRRKSGPTGQGQRPGALESPPPQGLRLPEPLLRKAKEYGFSDIQIGYLLGFDEEAARAMRQEAGIRPAYKLVDTCGAEFEPIPLTTTPRTRRWTNRMSPQKKKVMILGEAPNRSVRESVTTTAVFTPLLP